MSIHKHYWSLISWLTINPKCLNILPQAGVYRAWHFTLLGVLPSSLYARCTPTQKLKQYLSKDSTALPRFSCMALM